MRAGALFPSVTLDRDHGYTLYLNEQPEVRSGVQLRKLPLDPTEPLFVSQRPGESAHRSHRGSASRACSRPRPRTERSSISSWTARPPLKAAALSPGAHNVMLRYAGTRHRASTRSLSSRRGSRGRRRSPRCPQKTRRWASRRSPKARHVSSIWPRAPPPPSTCAPTRPGLYVLESTGLLATEGNLRSRVVTSFARESGKRRGAQLRAAPVPPRGRLPAHGQVAAAVRGPPRPRAPAHEDGRRWLPAQPAARAGQLRAGDAVAYRFTITTPGDFRVRALGLGRTFRCRLEDEDGWPLVPPGGPADVTRTFDPGRYRLVVLPEATDARVVSPSSPLRAGARAPAMARTRCPWANRRAPLARARKGQERAPDVWTLVLPAAAR